MRKTKAVLFDLDGVLIDSKEAWFHLVNATARRFAKAAILRQTFDDTWGQGIEADLETFFSGCTQEQVRDFYDQHLLDYADSIRVDRQAKPTLQALRSADLKIAVVTNTPTDLARSLVHWMGFREQVDAIVGASADRFPKPAPDSILRACQQLHITPADAVFVGDSRFDKQAAEAAACRFIGFHLPAKESVTELRAIVEKIDAH